MPCFFPVEGGTFVTGIFARIHRRMVALDCTHQDEHPENEFEVFPVPDMELRGVYRVPVKGGVSFEPEFAGFGGASYVSLDDFDAFLAADSSDREATLVSMKLKSPSRAPVRAAGLKHLQQEYEESFEDAEGVIFDFIREVVSEFGVDVKGFKRRWVERS
jgi:hypothetical protein